MSRVGLRSSAVRAPNTVMLFQHPNANGPKCRSNLHSWEQQDVVELCPNATSFTMAHEFGHVLGFEDQYNLKTGKHYPGFGSDIMGVDGGTVEWQHLQVLRWKYARR